MLRLHRHQRDRGRRCRIVFFPDPICWTEAPSSLRVLIRQRDRWQRGLLQMLWKHRRMVGRRRYGTVGTLALPYFAVFEAAGPLIELGGYLVFALALLLGAVSWATATLFLTLAVGFGFVISFMTLLMEERAFRRYPTWSSLGRLLAASIIENVGYRQLLSAVRARGWWTQARGEAALLAAAAARLVAGDEDPEMHPSQRRWARRIQESEDPRRKIDLYVGYLVEVSPRVAGLIDALRATAPAEPEVAAFLEQMERGRREGPLHLLGSLAERGELREGLDAKAVADIVFAVVSPDSVRALTVGCGWKAARARELLSTIIARQLVVALALTVAPAAAN